MLGAGEPYSIEYRLRRGWIGDYRWHSAQAILRKDEHGKVLGWFGTCIDIEERKRAEEALHEVHERLAAILQQMSDGFAVFDRQWRYTHVNPAAAKAFQMSPEQLLGKTIWEMWPPARDLPELALVSAVPWRKIFRSSSSATIPPRSTAGSNAAAIRPHPKAWQPSLRTSHRAQADRKREPRPLRGDGTALGATCRHQQGTGSVLLFRLP